MRHDSDTTDDYHSYGGAGNDADTIFAILIISGRQTDSKIHTVSWQCTASGSVWIAGDLLSEECEPFYRQSWFARIRFYWTCCDLALLEAADASVNCRRNYLLYATGAVCILGSFFVCFVLQ